MARAIAVLVLAACSSDSHSEETPAEERPAIARLDDPARDPGSDAAVAPDAFAATEALQVIRARAAQAAPKMKLTAEQAAAAERHLRKHIERSASLRTLHASMPHSVVELARAIEERALPEADADRIADYLSHLVEALDFAKLRRFDINHSHVTGREWHEIDYSGENMTWQGQKEYWSRRGVTDFKTAASIHAYMKQAYRLPHFARVYAPRNTFEQVRPPE